MPPSHDRMWDEDNASINDEHLSILRSLCVVDKASLGKVSVSACMDDVAAVAFVDVLWKDYSLELVDDHARCVMDPSSNVDGRHDLPTANTLQGSSIAYHLLRLGSLIPFGHKRSGICGHDGGE